MEAAAALLREQAGGEIDVAIVLGSGLGDALDARFSRAVSYAEMPGFPQALVAGHPGRVLCGTWRSKRVAAFAGRFHLYQGYTAAQVVTQVLAAAHAGASTLVVTNAAGALDPAYRAGDLMLIADHLNLTGASPLQGLDLGLVRRTDPFVDMLHAYDRRLRARASKLARHAGIAVREGVYAAVAGPSYETPAEAAMLRGFGADAVGMSTVHETIAGRALGLSILGISTITNVVGNPTSHEEVLAVGRETSRALDVLLDGLIGE